VFTAKSPVVDKVTLRLEPAAGVMPKAPVVVLMVVACWKATVALFSVTTSEPSMEITPAETLAIVVSVACPRFIEPTPSAVVVSLVNPVKGSPVQLVSVPEVGVPNMGVTKVGEVENTRFVEVVPVVPAAVKPVILLKRAIEAVVQSRSTLAISGARDVFLERLQKLVGDLHAKDNVKLLGFVPDEEIAVLYKNSIAFVYPSIMEGFGLQGLEAMTSETLLLASEIPVFKEIYKDNAIYFNPFDFSDIARKMEIAKEMSEPRRKEIIAKAKKFVSNYSWKKMAQETLEVYNSVLS